MIACPRCHRPKKDGFALCWKCHVQEIERAAYQRGYLDGASRSVGMAAARPTIDPKRWRQLMQLAHPDKHGGSATATEVAQWLAAVRPS